MRFEGCAWVDLTATNQKLEARTLRLVQRLTGCSTTTAVETLQSCNGELKTAVICLTKETTPTEARRILAAADGHLRRALESEPDE